MQSVESDSSLSQLPADSPTAPRHALLASLRSPRGLLGLALVLVPTLLALAAPLIAPYDPEFQDETALEQLGPSLKHLFGSDELGRDLFSRVLYGARVDFLISLGGAFAGSLIGSTLGLLAAIVRPLDAALQRMFDVLLAFPALVLGIAVAIVAGPGVTAVIITLVLINVPIFGKLARNGVIALRGREYALAARAFGASESWVVRRHLLPNARDPLIVQGALSAAQATIVESGMSFVGLGVQLPTPSLGNMLQGSLAYLHASPVYAIGPMLPLVSIVLGLNLIADAMTNAIASDK